MKKYLIVAVILILSGCTLHPDANITTSTSVEWTAHKQQLQSLSKWTLNGKLAIFIGKERQTANIYWQQNDQNYTIELTSFIGTRLMRIKKDDHGVEIINNDGETFTGEDTETLINELSPGLALPITSLQQWVKGNPIGASFQLNDQQLVKELLGKDKQNNLWAVNLQKYQHISGVNLPHKLDLTRGEIRIKISINRWQLNKVK